MQFVIIAQDQKDPDAINRRMACRQDHIDTIDAYKAKGNMLMGVALLDDNQQMAGSVIVCDFPDRAALDAWLKIEPYVVNNVWGELQIHDAKIGPSFLASLSS